MVTKEMLDRLDHLKQVAFAVFCTRQAIDLLRDDDKAIEAAEGFIEARISKEECRTAAEAYAANAAANAARAAHSAAYTAAYVAYAAAYAGNVARQKTIDEQLAYYNELLNFDSIVEDMVGI